MFGLFLCVLVSQETLGRKTALSQVPAFGELHRLLAEICAAISTDSPENLDVTWVFALYVTPEHRSSLNFLWKFPNTHMYLAREPILLNLKDRGIIVSWEHDGNPKKGLNYVWDLYSPCGHSSCGKSKERLDLWQLERRVLVQVRELMEAEVYERPPEKILRRLSGRLRLKNYLHFYRTVIVVLGREELHSSFTVKPSGLESVNNVRELQAKGFVMEDARNAFESIKYVRNRSETLVLDLFSISSSTGNTDLEIPLRTCLRVSTLFWRMSIQRCLGDLGTQFLQFPELTPRRKTLDQ